RFLKPVPVGARVRALFAVKETAEAARGGIQVTWSVSIEVEHPDAPVPVCAAEFITLHYF
ncbi:MAG: MaoC family dehydratase, partial [Burkholderia sp.]|nr:MaoC family dehydratase [Burkholderia sp.]